MQVVQDRDRFEDLLEALEKGWKIDEPVLVGKMWRTNSNGDRTVYHFVLRNMAEGKTIMLSLPFSPALQIYLTENNIQTASLS